MGFTFNILNLRITNTSTNFTIHIHVFGTQADMLGHAQLCWGHVRRSKCNFRSWKGQFCYCLVHQYLFEFDRNSVYMHLYYERVNYVNPPKLLLKNELHP